MSPRPRRSLVVSAVVLLLVASVGTSGWSARPTKATTPAASTGSDPPSAESGEKSARELKATAIAALESLEVEGRSQRGHRNRAIEALNASTSAHRDADRVRRAAFRHDRASIRSMARLNGAPGEAAATVADRVVAADLATAETSLGDARRASRRFGGQLDASGRRHVERAIGRAERSLDRGRRAADAGGRQGPKRIQAVGRFHRAWLASQRALDEIDQGVQPAVTIDTRADPAWNGSVPRTRTIRGTISAVRPYDLPGLAVSVDGRMVRVVALDAPTAPARNATFAVNVSLAAPPVEVAVAVADQGVSRRSGKAGRDSERRQGRASHRKSDHQFGGPAGGQATAVVRFDGDGLPDTYESATVGTDPLDRDSDSRRTYPDEAGDGRPDGGEDFDGDRLITFAEFDRGTDPFVGDTDGDGLLDRFEASSPALDATRADTDRDGEPDGAEDFDRDGLPAADERAAGTSIWTADTDRDGLEDGPEVDHHGTSPVAADTDGDGLEDGEERRLGTDPTDRDTDGDGVLDGDERFRTSTVEPETGASVTIVGTGDVASGVTIDPVDQPTGLDVVAGPVVRIENRSAFETATVSVPIDDQIGRADVSMYTWEPGSDRPWHPIVSSVDRANGTVRANVSSFSYFTVVDQRRWRNVTGDTVRVEWPHFEGFDDLAGWSADAGAEMDDGRLIVSANGAVIVVDEDGGGDFRRIQPAVDAAGSGDTVVVREGTYAEQVVLHTPIRLVGVDATLQGPSVEGETVGIQVVDEVPSRVSGFRIDGYDRGIGGAWTSSDVRVEGVTFADTGYPIAAEGTTGDWHLEGVVAGETRSYAVNAGESAGDWLISNSTFTDGGIRAYSSSGDWTVSDAAITGRYDGIDVWQASGDWRLRRTRLSALEDGIDAHKAGGDVTLVDVVIAGNDVGIDGFRTAGNWTVAGANLSRNGDYGVYSAYSTGSWTIEDANVSGNGISGIVASHSAGDWTLTDVVAAGNANEGIDAYGTAGDWNLSRVEATRNGGKIAVDGYGSSGDWTVTSVDVSENDNDGLAAPATSGNWRVSGARIVGNGATGLQIGWTRGTITVDRSTIHGNVGVDVDGRSAARQIRAAHVWWGRPGGPSGGQVLGDVAVVEACADSGCAPPTPRIDPFDGRRIAASVTPAPVPGPGPTAAGVARVSRGLRLPAASTTVTITANVSSELARDGSAGIRLRAANETATVVSFSGNGTVPREVTATLPDVSADWAVVEVVAEGNATITVDWVSLSYDSDGDGLRDLVERSDLALPFGPVPGAPLDDLDPSNPDTDGDGMLDGQEMTVETIAQGPGETSRTFVIRPASATSDPTTANSDGGGLNDSEEWSRGSDPFVLETLVAGYAVPTMTEGSGERLVDANPMTMDEVDGLQIGDRAESDLIAWPSRQFFDPFFCIEELTPGPGCAPAWMRGVDVREDRHYVYVPFIVYAKSNVDLPGAPYQLSFTPSAFAQVVKVVNDTGRFGPRETHEGYVVYELPDESAGVEAQIAAFRSIGSVRLRVDLRDTIFTRADQAEVGRGYAVSTSTLLPRTEQLLADTRFTLSQGLTVAGAAETGYGVALRTGSRFRGVLAFLFELALGQLDTPPKSVSDLGKEASDRGIAAFEKRIHAVEGDIQEDVFGNSSVRPVGPIIMRFN